MESEESWYDFRVDLSRWAGEEVIIEVEAAAGGHLEWHWEVCFLADVRIETR